MKKNTPVALLFASSMLGKLKPEIIRRIEKYLRKPSFETWDDISSIIIDPSGRMKTVWNAVIDNDPFFPRRGRTTNRAGEVVREWERIPAPQEVIEAINKTVFKQLKPSN